jgi:hypothetical protein
MRPLSVKKSESMEGGSEVWSSALRRYPATLRIISATGYVWRQLNQNQRKELLEWRRIRGYPWHSPPHGYAKRWTDWPWSSAAEYLARAGVGEAKRAWREYPIHEYGKNWDDPEM